MPIQKQFNKKVNIYQVQSVLAEYVFHYSPSCQPEPPARLVMPLAGRIPRAASASASRARMTTRRPLGSTETAWGLPRREGRDVAGDGLVKLLRAR
jgi:hypothetical protein